MADYEFKNKNTNIKVIKKIVEGKVEEIVKEEVKEVVKIFKTKNPSYVWSAAKPKKYRNLNDALENLEEEFKEKSKSLKKEFVCNNMKGQINLRKAKERNDKARF